MNSDAINRKRIKFTVGALEDAIYKNCITGIPALVSHDGLRPIGWNYPFGLYFEPGLTRLIGEWQMVENDEDQKAINKAYSSVVSRRYHDLCEPHRELFEAIISKFQTKDGRYIGLNCASFQDNEILDRVYPTLKSQADDDGLFFVDDLLKTFDYLGQGVFRDKTRNLAIFCHQFFRRSLSHINQVNFDFLDRFMPLYKQRNVRIRIALDYNLIGLASTFHPYEELEYVWGPTYNDDVANIKVGVTNLKCDEQQKLFSGVSGMEFWWKKDKKNNRVLEAEELRDTSTDGPHSGHYGCRYVHSVFNIKDGLFDHFDGAIRSYDTDEMIVRLDNDIKHAGKSSKYTKLFRIDGALPLNDWKSLITLYYQGNPLTYEYFGLKEEHEKLFGHDRKSEPTDLIDQLIPYKIDSGIRLFLSYHKPTEITDPFDRIVINPDTVTIGEERMDTIEFYTLELKKALGRKGENLSIPTNIQFLSTRDSYINFPTILHSSSNTSEKIEATIASYIDLFDAMNTLNPIVTMTLAWPLNDREVRASIFGSTKDVGTWLKNNRRIPLDYQKFRNWVEEQNHWLTRTYSKRHQQDFLDLISHDGVIFIHRKMVNPEWIKFKETDKGLMYELTLPKGLEFLATAVSEERIRPGIFFIVKDAKCSKTQSDYFLSDTSRVLDSDVSVSVTPSGPLGAFWTDSPLI